MGDAKSDKRHDSVLEDKEKFGADNADQKIAHMGDKSMAGNKPQKPGQARQPEKK
jgi:hypothetical protein